MARRNSTLVVLVAVLGIATVFVVASWSKAKGSTPSEPLFLHRFSEVTSERPGFRKYVGITKRIVISGTILGALDASAAPPVGAYGAVAIGHTLFYRTKDFTANGVSEGTSVLFVPVAMKLPAELLKP